MNTTEVTNAFRQLQNATLIGKAIIKLRPFSTDTATVKQAKQLYLDPEASYLLTGGFGGLGRLVARWMAERGAKSLVFLSPRAGASQQDQNFMVELESMGCSVVAERGKAQVLEDVHHAARRAPKPIKGVIHFALVIRVCGHVFYTFFC